jgi:hypothetical protein
MVVHLKINHAAYGLGIVQYHQLDAAEREQQRFTMKIFPLDALGHEPDMVVQMRVPLEAEF